MVSQDIALFIYNLTLLPIIFFSVLFIILTIMNIFLDKKKEKFRELKELPFITVQVPTYNDPIAERCIRHCMEFDYPKNKYEILIADDSTSIDTQNLLAKFADDDPEFIKYFHRDNRQGFKAGALKNSMKFAKGEFIVIFDADWIPGKSFLKKIVRPFSDPKVAIVQTRQGFYNKHSNLITRFASYLMMIYHTVVMPINNRINCVFFCGTAGAIRKSTFEKIGGWNLNSITEDSDLSVNLLLKGYKTIYLDFETPSEVPATFESFIKQQMRWCYGNTRVFIDNASNILIKKGLSLKQRLMILFITLGNVAAPLVFFMTIAGFSTWFLGEPTLFNLNDIITLVTRILLTAGFLVMGAIALYKRNILREFPCLLLSVFTMGIVLAVANSIAFFKAVSNKQLSWFCTAKEANDEFV
jgi:cellulose synthase/poly-beta-1,6-N-acetylglucosamine synthase-like glycosyltransferase|tara:strand:+ start:5389 stop:6627 length:1239 start_codon:yes stop_codon:yes gene_type:complete